MCDAQTLAVGHDGGDSRTAQCEVDRPQAALFVGGVDEDGLREQRLPLGVEGTGEAGFERGVLVRVKVGVRARARARARARLQPYRVSKNLPWRRLGV